MTTLPLFPIWLAEALSAVLVLCFTWLAYRLSRRLMAQDPENPLWLFLNWLATAFVIFACTHALSHALQDIITFYRPIPWLVRLRRLIGGLDSIIYVAIATITLFFHRMQRLYHRMETDHHQLEETTQEILALNREMEALVMERTMAEMALGMAHGIRNPLHVIGGFSHRLLKKTDPADPTRTWLTTIADEARRIEQIVARFETLAQRKTSFFDQEDLNLIIAETLELIRPEIKAKKLSLISDLHPQPIRGRFNKHLLRVALAHLLRNAIEATGPYGRILLRTLLEKDFAVVIVQDNGRGMSAEVVDKVFVPFYTTKIGGTGLGMVFVRQIVDEHRGVIHLTSQINQGTTVTIRLPLRFTEAPEVSQDLEEAIPQTTTET